MGLRSTQAFGTGGPLSLGLLPPEAASDAGLAASVVEAEGPRLDAAPTGQPCRVIAVRSPDGQADWGRWLAEIGFLPGEHVMVTARSMWGGDPMVVRVGQSTFALRRAEAACVRIEPLDAQAPIRRQA